MIDRVFLASQRVVAFAPIKDIGAQSTLDKVATLIAIKQVRADHSVNRVASSRAN